MISDSASADRASLLLEVSGVNYFNFDIFLTKTILIKIIK